jgi:hypothetical protein
MLLNFSNHPCSEWDQKQLSAARELYGSIEDLTFPSIDPEATEERILELVEEYSPQILMRFPKAVHIMGEMTFVYAMVRRLQQENISCIASTSNRKAIKLEDGSYRRVFEFTGFRPYASV